jgi:hypothetical protein
MSHKNYKQSCSQAFSTVPTDDLLVSQQSLSECSDPDWDTFEEVEAYVTGEAGGVLETVLPKPVWKYLFAPTDADPTVLSRHREQIVELYESVLDVYHDAQSQLVLQSNRRAVDRDYNSVNEILDDCDRDWYPASVESRNQFDSLSEYITAIEQALA